jgi:hypothetical protein
MISPLILFCRTSASLVSIKTYPPRLIQMVLRKRDGSSTSIVFCSGSVQEYKQFPSALMTRAMAWVVVKDEGGVEVSSAAAKTLRLGRPILERFTILLSVSELQLEEISSWCGLRCGYLLSCSRTKSFENGKVGRNGKTMLRRG